MSVVLDRPYQFIPPHRGNWWPTLIQRFRIIDHYLRIKEGVCSFECRNLGQFKEALDNEAGILLTPNHCRYADPIAMGWPARLVGTHVYAMASWHLFNKGRIDHFAIRKMGGFSIHREGADRQSLGTAMQILSEGERPLIVFPEGTTSRMNDEVKPLLDGVSFIARSAARKSAKLGLRNVVMLPVAIKYLCKVDCVPWLQRQIAGLEQAFGQEVNDRCGVVVRLKNVMLRWLELKELDFFGERRSGDTSERRLALIGELLSQLETQFGTDSSTANNFSRIRAIRSEIVTRCFQETAVDGSQFVNAVKQLGLCQELETYKDSYLSTESMVTDTRLIETVQRLQEFEFGKAKQDLPLHAVIQFGQAIKVSAEKPPRGKRDPLLQSLHDNLNEMLGKLSHEARPVATKSLA